MQRHHSGHEAERHAKNRDLTGKIAAKTGSGSTTAVRRRLAAVERHDAECRDQGVQCLSPFSLGCYHEEGSQLLGYCSGIVFCERTRENRKTIGLCTDVLILLTNDDGIHAPGLVALQRQLRTLGDVYVVAPATEQSGVGHSITYLTPLIVKNVFHDQERWGWAVEGTPADCVKIGTTEICPRRPDLIVSGINGGLNAGINVLYSGTVAAAIEGAFYGITSVAVSLEFDAHAKFDKAAQLATALIAQIVAKEAESTSEANGAKEVDSSRLYNLNIPTAALHGTPPVSVVPMDTRRYSDRFERRADPWGREYFWLAGGPPTAAEGHETDLSALAQGHITLTPLDYNLTNQARMAAMQPWQLDLTGTTSRDTTPHAKPSDARRVPVMRMTRNMRSDNGSETD